MKFRNINILKREYNYTIQRRGYDIYENGLVYFNNTSNNIMTYEVEGSSYNSYKVEVYFNNNEINEIICDCPCDFPCKHEYAVLMNLDNNDETDCYSILRNKEVVDKERQESLDNIINNLDCNTLKEDILYLINEVSSVNEYFYEKYNKFDVKTDVMKYINELLKLATIYEKIRYNEDYEEYDDYYKDYSDYEEYDEDSKRDDEFEQLIIDIEFIEGQLLKKIKYNNFDYVFNFIKEFISRLDNNFNEMFSFFTHVFKSFFSKFLKELTNKHIKELCNLINNSKDEFNITVLISYISECININNYNLFKTVMLRQYNNYYEQSLEVIEKYINTYYPNEIINYYKNYMNNSKNCVSLVNYYLDNKEVDEVFNIIREIEHSDMFKRDKYNLLDDINIDLFKYYIEIEDKENSMKYSIITLSDYTLRQNYQFVKDNNKYLNLFIDRAKEVVSSTILCGFFFKEGFTTLGLDYINNQPNLIVSHFNSVYCIDKQLTLTIFKKYLLDYNLVVSNNYEYQNIYSALTNNYIKEEHEYFIKLANYIIANTKKRNLKTLLTKFIDSKK